MRRYAVITLACFVLTTAAPARTCREVFADLYPEAVRGVDMFLFYPLYLVQAHRDRLAAWRRSPERAVYNRPDFLTTVVEELLTRRGLLVTFAYLPFLIFGPTLFVSHSDFVAASAEWDDFDRENDVVVVVNGFSDRFNSTVRSEYDRVRRRGRRVFHVDSTDLAVVRTQVREIAEREGRISRLYVGAHGAPGRVYLGNRFVNTEVAIDELFPEADRLFRENLRIRFFSCSVARGDEGSRRLASLVNRMPAGTVAFAMDLPSEADFPADVNYITRALPALHFSSMLWTGSIGETPPYSIDPQSRVIRVQRP